MSVQRCIRAGRPGFRAISASGEGDCFMYQPGNEAAKKAAQVGAHRQLDNMVARSKDENIRAVLESIACI